MPPGSPRPFFFTARNACLLLGGFGLYGGFATANALLLGAGVYLLTLVAISMWRAWPLLKGVDGSRRHPERAFQEEELPVSLEFSLGTVYSELVLVSDYFSPGSRWRHHKLADATPKPGARMEWAYLGTCDHRRGLYVLGPVHFQATDPLGMFSREETLEVFTDLIVFPLAVNLAECEILDKGILAHVGLEMTRRTGYSEEFVGIREYRSGDPSRAVHWLSSARTGKLMVKEFREETTTLVSLFVDLGRQGLTGVGDQTSVEYGIRSCASLARHAVRRGHFVQFFGVSSEVDWIPRGGGISHLLAILDRLSLAKANNDSNFCRTISELIETLPRGSTAVLITGATTVDAALMERAVEQARERRILPLVVLVDDRAFLKIYRDQERLHATAVPLPVLIERLALSGARVHCVTKDKSVEQALIQGLERSAHFFETRV